VTAGHATVRSWAAASCLPATGWFVATDEWRSRLGGRAARGLIDASRSVSLTLAAGPGTLPCLPQSAAAR
jgi:hypothetical protein